MSEYHADDPVSLVMEQKVHELESLNNPKYYNLLTSFDKISVKLTGQTAITRRLRNYAQKQRGKYGLYNWYLSLWGLEHPLNPAYILSKTIVVFLAAFIIATLASFISVALSIIIMLIGYMLAKSYVTSPAKVVNQLRETVLMYYPQCAIVFAARNTRELFEILEEIDVIGHEVRTLKAQFLQHSNTNAATLEEAISEYLNRHPLHSMGLIKDMLLTFDTIDPEVRKQQKLNIMRLFPFELTEFFDRITDDFKQIQSFSLMFSEMVVFSCFMMLAIFGLIDSPLSLILPAMVIIIADTFFHSMLLNSMSIRMFYNYSQAKTESDERKRLIKPCLLVGALISITFGLFVGNTNILLICTILGTPALAYMFASIFSVITVEQYTTPMHLHQLIREYIAMVSAIKKETSDTSMIRSFVRGIEHGYYGALEHTVKPLVSDINMGVELNDVLTRIHERAFNKSQIIRPYLFFLNKIMNISPVRGKNTDTNPAELFDVVYDVSSQILRPLAMRFDTIITTGTNKATFTGIINGITTGIFVILGKIFQNVLMKGFGNMGDFLNPASSGGSMSSWMYEFMTGMIGHLTGTDLIAASLVSLSGTYLGVYTFQSNRTGAYVASVISAVVVSYFGFMLMEKLIGMMMNMM